MDNQFADFGRSGEGDLVYVGMCSQSSAGGFTVSGNDIDDAFRESGFHDQLAQT